MNKIEYLLTCLAEECSEVAHACGKSLRFGVKHYEYDNAKQILLEFNDIMAIMELLQAEGVFDGIIDRHLIVSKKERLAMYMEKSRKLGKLDDPIPDGVYNAMSAL